MPFILEKVLEPRRKLRAKERRKAMNWDKGIGNAVKKNVSIAWHQYTFLRAETVDRAKQQQLSSVFGIIIFLASRGFSSICCSSYGLVPNFSVHCFPFKFQTFILKIWVIHANESCFCNFDLSCNFDLGSWVFWKWKTVVEPRKWCHYV